MKRGADNFVVGLRRKGKASWKRQLGLSIEKDLPMGGHSRQHCENRITVFNPMGNLGSCGLQGVKLKGGDGGEWALRKEEMTDEIDNPGEVCRGPS